jgi:hypothetical protein
MSFDISYLDLTKFHYFATTTERGDSGWKERVTLQITLLHKKFDEFPMSLSDWGSVAIDILNLSIMNSLYVYDVWN